MGHETHCTLCQTRIHVGGFRQDCVGNIFPMRVQAMIQFESWFDKVGGDDIRCYQACRSRGNLVPGREVRS